MSGIISALYAASWTELFTGGLVGILTYGILCMVYDQMKWRSTPTGTQAVPVVDGCLPFVGHGTKFSKDIMAFVNDAYKKYGPIFRVRIFRTDMIIVCDHRMKKDYFRGRETEMSLYKVLSRLFFGDAFSDDPNSLPTIIDMVKGTVAVQFDDFAPKIMMEAQTMVDRMRHNVGTGQRVIQEEMIRFVARTSARCFMDMDIDDEFYESLMKFTHLLNRIVVLTYFFPKWLLARVMSPFLRVHRMAMIEKMYPIIAKYRANSDLKDSMVFRHCVDTPKENGQYMTDREIGEVCVCLLYVSSENTALGASAALTDLGTHPENWERIKAEGRKFIEDNDIAGLFKSKEFMAHIHESARLGTHIFPLNRQPVNRNSVLGTGDGNLPYFVGNADSVVLCEPIMMAGLNAEGLFKDPEVYNPDRFLVDGEQYTSTKVMTWGSGFHLCPGKMFAVYETIAAMALITNNFEYFDIQPDQMGERDYFSPSAFSERIVTTQFKPVPEDQLPVVKSTSVTINHGDREYEVRYIPSGDESTIYGGWLIRNCLTPEEQLEFFRYTHSLAEGSAEQGELYADRETVGKTAYPLAFNDLVYTGTSNCPFADKWNEFGMKIWTMFKDNQDDLKFPKTAPKIDRFNSMYAQLFGSNASMSEHKDQYVNWGISVNLGASATFTFDGVEYTLNSGDVFVADFSKHMHAVKEIHAEETFPSWMRPEFLQLEENADIMDKWYGRTRMSVQLRSFDVDEFADKRITIDEFKTLVTGKSKDTSTAQ